MAEIKQARIDIGGSSYQTSYVPYVSDYCCARFQYIITASELMERGVMPGFKIKGISLYSYSNPNTAMDNFRIRLKEVGTKDKLTRWEKDDLTLLHHEARINTSSFRHNTWREYSFNQGTQEYIWSGENLLIDITKDGISTSSGGGNYVRDGLNAGRGAGGQAGYSGYSYPFDTLPFNAQTYILDTIIHYDPPYNTYGTWTSNSISLINVEDYDSESSHIDWIGNTPEGTSLTIFTGLSDDSLTEPSTWTAITNGSGIGGASGNLSTKYLWIKAELSTTDSNITPELDSITVDIWTSQGTPGQSTLAISENILSGGSSILPLTETVKLSGSSDLPINVNVTDNALGTVILPITERTIIKDSEYIDLIERAVIHQEDNLDITERVLIAASSSTFIKEVVKQTPGSSNILLYELIKASDASILPLNESISMRYGDPEDPRLIYTAADFNDIRNHTNDYFVLMNDIDLSGAHWTAIPVFKGQIDGNGFVVRGLNAKTIFNESYNSSTGVWTITTLQRASFFINANKGIIKNIAFEGMNIRTTTDRYGSNTNDVSFINTNSGTVKNVVLKGIFTNSNYNSTNGVKVSGMCINNSGTIEDCYIDVEVVLSNYSYSNTAGAIYIMQAGGLIKNCLVRNTSLRNSPGRPIFYTAISPDQIVSCYYNKDELGHYTGLSQESLGRTSTELKTKATYVGWDFINTWDMKGSNYPYNRFVSTRTTNSLSVVEDIKIDGSSLLPIIENITRANINLTENILGENSVMLPINEKIFSFVGQSTLPVSETILKKVFKLPLVERVYKASESATIPSNEIINKPNLILEHTLLNPTSKTNAYVESIAGAAKKSLVVGIPALPTLDSLFRFGNITEDNRMTLSPPDSGDELMYFTEVGVSPYSPGIYRFLFTNLTTGQVLINVSEETRGMYAFYMPINKHFYINETDTYQGRIIGPPHESTYSILYYRSRKATATGSATVTINYPEVSNMFQLGLEGTNLNKSTTTVSVDGGVTWQPFNQYQWYFRNYNYSYALIKFDTVYDITIVNRILFYGKAKPSSNVSTYEYIVFTGTTSFPLNEKVWMGRGTREISINEKTMQDGLIALPLIESVRTNTYSSLPLIDKIFGHTNNTLPITERTLTTSYSNVSLLEDVKIHDVSLLPLTERIFTSNYSNIPLEERVAKVGSNSASLSERVVRYNVRTLPLYEGVMDANNNKLPVNERVVLADTNTLQIIETIINGGHVNLVATERIKAYKSKVLDMVEDIKISGKKTVLLRETIYQADTDSIKLSEFIKSDTQSYFPIRETIFGVASGSITTIEYVTDESYDVLVRKSIFGRITGK